MDRIDKILANLGFGTRKEIKAVVKNGEVKINGTVIKDSSMKIDPDKSTIEVGGNVVEYKKNIYLLMNKPQGVVSATFDNYDETVIDILEPEYQAFKPFPVGRLDKDTEGLLLITNDGELNHRMISPKNHVDKVYYAEIDKYLDERDVNRFKKGIQLKDGYKCLPGKLHIIESDEDGAKVEVTIQEGKFHQVKRMFNALGKNVVYLKRIKFGPIDLDKDLNLGQYRELSKNEIESIKRI
ncbi:MULTISPECIES: pseudouridine synthase [Clostridium]|nr:MULTISPECIES: pseudouridine synthase [Clostridium]AGY75784.1 rRNA pseudouridine synthase [Clostridium autoethanogenum DSM 10061]ALU35949.1 Pseudouridine synthase Rsu [Clostridium autoethanogenum DSM 10061]OAA89398.1 Ribosomal small subunit pseudouridine synthase A [Clostridium ljungdahlii DSM 13528]OVY51993.1 Ribosomal small subunit pseudouridine synthase A [Clostridium autoethanogenum]